MFHPLCGFSLQKGAKYIAIADLLICILGLTFRLIVYDYYEYQEYEIETELYGVNNNGTLDDPVSGNLTHSMEETDYSNSNSINLTHLLEAIRQTSSELDHYGDPHYYELILIIKMVIAVVLYVVYICLEVWLCRLLLRASNNRDGGACKTWFWFRLLITIFILIYSIVGIATLKHDWVDWVLEPLNIYRIYELFVVNEFRREIVATSGRVKLRA